MALSKTEIDAVVHELRPCLLGGWIQKVFQPLPDTVTLDVRTRGRTLSLLVSVEPRTARLHILSKRLTNPQTPPAFCQFLRAHIQGGRIEEVEQVGGDRIVRLVLTTREGSRSLVAALTGNRADLLLVDGDGKIHRSLHHGREIVGRTYEPPAHRAATPERGEPVERDEESEFPVSHAIERRYVQADAQQARQQARQARMAQIRRAIKKTSRRLAALQADIEKAERYRAYARYGELLKANLGAIEKGMDQLTVIDYFDPGFPELIIPLDPAKGSKGNMEDYFRKHRKYLAAEREVRPRQQQTELELQALQQERREIEEGTWEPPLPPASRLASRPAGAREGRAGRKSEPVVKSGPFRRFVSADGCMIYVGRNAKENEELTHKFARSDDVWLHAHGVPGSHVVVRIEKGADPPPETLKDAATLALLYSDLKKSGKGEVIYTRKKWVRKAKGRPPGTVTVTREKSQYVKLEKSRLEALKQRSRKDARSG